MKKHKKQINTSASDEREVFVLPPDLLEKLGIQLSHITGQNVENGGDLLQATNDVAVDLRNGVEGSSILETANLMKKSVFLSPTFVSSSTVSSNELNGIFNTPIETQDNVFQDDNEILKDNSTGRINKTNEILSNINEITPAYNVSFQSEDLRKRNEYIKEYEIDNKTYSSNTDMDASDFNIKSTDDKNSDDTYLSDCSHSYSEISNNNLDTLKEKTKPDNHNKIKILSEKILNHPYITHIQNSHIQKTSNSFIVPVNSIVTGKMSSYSNIDRNYLDSEKNEGTVSTSEEIDMKIGDDSGQDVHKKIIRNSINQNGVGDDYRNNVSELRNFATNEAKTLTSKETVYCALNHEEQNLSNKTKIENDELVIRNKVPAHNNYENSQCEIIVEGEQIQRNSDNDDGDKAVNANDIMSQIERDRQLKSETRDDTNKEIFSNTKNNIIKSKLCIQGVEKPGGSRENNVAEVIKTYQRTSRNKKIPEVVNLDSTDLIYSTLPNEIDIIHDNINIVGHKNVRMFCVCYDFGQLANYDTESVYEHIHFWNHIHNNCKLETLLSIYDDISPMRELYRTEDFDEIDNDVETSQDNICWSSFNCEDLESETKADITDDSTARQPIRRSTRKRNSAANEQVTDISEPKSKKTIKCGVCGLMLSEVQWNKHNDSEHNSIAWKDGQAVDLENKKILKKLGLKLKQYKYLRCTFCKADIKNSVKKYIQHIKLCIEQKVDNTPKIEAKVKPNDALIDNANVKITLPIRRSSRIGINVSESFLQNEENATHLISSKGKQINDLNKTEDIITTSELKHRAVNVETDTLDTKLRKCSQKALVISKDFESPGKHSRKPRDLDVSLKSTNVETNPKIRRGFTDVSEMATSISLDVGFSTRSKRSTIEASTLLKTTKLSVGIESQLEKKTDDVSSQSLKAVPKLKRCVDLSTKTTRKSVTEVLIDSKTLSNDGGFSTVVARTSVDGRHISKHKDNSSTSLLTPKSAKKTNVSKRKATEVPSGTETTNENPSSVTINTVEHESHPKLTKKVKRLEVTKATRECNELSTKPSNKLAEISPDAKAFTNDDVFSISINRVKKLESAQVSANAELESIINSSMKSVDKSTKTLKKVVDVSPELIGISTDDEVSPDSVRKHVSNKNFTKSIKLDETRTEPRSKLEKQPEKRKATKSTEKFTKAKGEVDAVLMKSRIESTEIPQKTRQDKSLRTSIKICEDISLKSTRKSVSAGVADKSIEISGDEAVKSTHLTKKTNTGECSEKLIEKSGKASVVNSKDTQNKDLSKSTRQLTDIDIFAKATKPTKVYSNVKKPIKTPDQILTDASVVVKTPTILENKVEHCPKLIQALSNDVSRVRVASVSSTKKDNTSRIRKKSVTIESNTQSKISDSPTLSAEVVAANKTVSHSKKSSVEIDGTVSSRIIPIQASSSDLSNAQDSVANVKKDKAFKIRVKSFSIEVDNEAKSSETPAKIADLTAADKNVSSSKIISMEINETASSSLKSTHALSSDVSNAQASVANTLKDKTSKTQEHRSIEVDSHSADTPALSAKLISADETVSRSKESLARTDENASSLKLQSNDGGNEEATSSSNQNETSPEEVQMSVVSIKEEISLCAVCKQGVEDSQWLKHIGTEHNYLAWRECDPPLDLQDEEAVKSHLYAITKANRGLECSKCGVVRKYVKSYIQHVKECDSNTTHDANVSSSSYKMNDSTALLDSTHDPDDAPLNTYKKKRKARSLADETVVCGVCSLVVQGSKWIEHIRVEHKYLAWRSDERPLNLDDEAEVKIHLQNISKYHHGLKCSKCGIVRLYVKKYLDHERTCTGSKDESMFDDTLSTSNVSADLIEIEILPENVKCGKCGKEVKGDAWIAHIEQKHHYLAWIEGNPPLDENNTEAVSAHLQRLVKKRGALLCVKCGLERKYPKAFLTHISACEITGFRHEEYFVDVSAPINPDEYECAVCHERGNRKDWKKHAMDKHYNVAWMAGEIPINLKNPYAVEKYLKEYRRKHDLVCKVCGASRVSCYGFYAHILTCGKEESELEHLMNMCDVCNNKYLCIYRNQHKAMHREQEYRKEQKEKDAKAKEENEKEIMDVEPSGKRRAAEKAKKVMEKYIANKTDDGSHVCATCHIGFDNATQLKEHTCAQRDDTSDSDTSVKIEQEESDDDDDDIDDVDSNISNEEDDAEVEEEEEEDDDRRKRHPEHVPKIVLPYKVKDFNYYLGRSYENFREQHLTNERLFDSWRHSQYQILSQDDFAEYLPALAESCKIRIDNDEWNTFKRFEGSKRVCGRGLALFTGASVRCIQWAPSCDDKKQDHYLAVACYRDADCPRRGTDELSHHPALLQIWNIGKFTTDPKFEVGLAHEFGTVWAMEWCPSGARDHTQDADQGGPYRLGLLAVACSNGGAYILDVPRYVTEHEHGPKIIKVKPVAELRFSMTPGRSKYQATALSWSPKKGHSVIMVGYSDGSTAFYDLNTNSPFLKTDENGVTVYYPFEDSLAENSPVTGVSLAASVSEHLVGGVASSSVTGATMSAWPSIGPVVRSHLAASNVLYTPNWPAALLCSDDVLTMKSTNEMEWWGGGRRLGGACAAGACARCGRVCLTAPPFVRVLRAHPCYPELKKQIVATVKMVPLAQKRKLKLTNDDLGMIVEPLTYDDTVKKYGLEFKSVPKKDQKIASKLCDNVEQCPERFPLSELPAAGFCPSGDHHNRLAIASHAGFIFIIAT